MFGPLPSHVLAKHIFLVACFLHFDLIIESLDSSFSLRIPFKVKRMVRWMALVALVALVTPTFLS